MPSLYFKTEGLVIKKMPFGEADFLVRMLTKDFGKIDILAKGARKSTSKLNMHLDILNHIRISFVKNGDRIPMLTDAEVIARYDDWFLDSEHISVAGRILQTLDQIILPGSKDGDLFLMTLGFFSAPDSSEEKAVRFLREIFEEQGYGNSLPPEYEHNIIKLWPILKI